MCHDFQEGSSEIAHLCSNYMLCCTLPRNHPAQAAGGRQLENGSWTGMMGLLTTGKADLALFPMTLTAQRAKHIQHTQPFQDGGYGILVKTQETQTGERNVLAIGRSTRDMCSYVAENCWGQIML
jgi:hypothetical protein